jgi:hypothetical protein
LLALLHAPYGASWRVTNDEDLPVATLEAVEKVVAKAIPDGKRRELMMAAYRFITTHPESIKPSKIRLKGQPEVISSPLRYLMDEIEQGVLPFTRTYE